MLVALVIFTCGRAQATPPDARPVLASEAASASSPASPEGVARQLEAFRLELSELRAGLNAATSGRTPPPWAAEMQARLDQRMERIAQMQERLAARVETPAPRLDEPIVLFTVAGCMLLFGFVVGRGVQRRSHRRDLRLRL